MEISRLVEHRALKKTVEIRDQVVYGGERDEAGLRSRDITRSAADGSEEAAC